MLSNIASTNGVIRSIWVNYLNNIWSLRIQRIQTRILSFGFNYLSSPNIRGNTGKDENAEPPKQPQTMSFFRMHYEVNKKKEVKKVNENIVIITSKSLGNSEIVNDSQICDNSTTKVQSINANFIDDDLKELIPSIEEFDSSLYELLPKTIQIRAKQRFK